MIEPASITWKMYAIARHWKLLQLIKKEDFRQACSACGKKRKLRKSKYVKVKRPVEADQYPQFVIDCRLMNKEQVADKWNISKRSVERLLRKLKNGKDTKCRMN